MNYIKAIYYQYHRKSHPVYLILVHLFLFVVSLGCCLLWKDAIQLPLVIQLWIYAYIFLSLHTYIPTVQHIFDDKWLFAFFFLFSPFGYVFSIFCPFLLLYFYKRGKLNYD